MKRVSVFQQISAAKRNRRGVAKIVLPVTASLLAAMAAGMYLVWICKLRGTDTLLLRIIQSAYIRESP
jgi:type II secretory pathway component PulK